jgi:hypothetical protein
VSDQPATHQPGDDDEPPELRGYQPSGTRPLRSPTLMRVMRVTIVLGVVGLIVPGLYATLALQARTAAVVCARAVAGGTLGVEPDARFEFAGPAGPSWYCYARGFDGREVLVRALGLIPG